MNIIGITGRLTAEPKQRATQDGKAVASFSVAVRRPFTGDKTDFFDITAWGKLGEFVGKYFHKGDMIAVDGYLTAREYETDDGKKRKVVEITASNCDFCGGKKPEEERPAEEVKPKEQRKTNAVDIYDDSDLPF